MDLKNWIRDVPDFPKPGILFRDISPLLADHRAWQAAMDRLALFVRPHRPDLLAGIESRGFLVTAPLALELGCGFIMVRKRGKLPGEKIECASQQTAECFEFAGAGGGKRSLCHPTIALCKGTIATLAEDGKQAVSECHTVK